MIGPLCVERADTADVLPLRGRVLGLARHGRSARMPRDNARSTRHWVVRDGQVVIGCASVMAVRGWMLRGMVVAPTRQRQGIGGLLLARVVADVDAGLWCNARAAAVGFYETAGWAVVGPEFLIRDAVP